MVHLLYGHAQFLPNNHLKNTSLYDIPMRTSLLENLVHKLHQVTPGNWFKKLPNAFEEYGFVQFQVNHSLFTFKNGKLFIASFVHVDDFLTEETNRIKLKNSKDACVRNFT